MDAAVGRWLAEWINQHPEDPTARVIRDYVARTQNPGIVSGECKIRLEHNGRGQYDLSITYINEPLDRFATLLGDGNDTRLRPCRNCGRLWYCAGRFDRRFCSDSCRVSFHRSTPRGREKYRVYMRGKMRAYRADERRRNETNLKLSTKV
jgi:hypothetical protein